MGVFSGVAGEGVGGGGGWRECLWGPGGWGGSDCGAQGQGGIAIGVERGEWSARAV